MAKKLHALLTSLVLGILAFSGPLVAQDGASPTAESASPPSPIELLINLSRSGLASQGFTRHQDEVAGQTLVWWQRGDGPALVFVHGVSDQAGTWVRLTPTLPRDRRIFLVDLPGHGESGPGDGPLAMTRVLNGFEAWLEKTVISTDEPSPVLVGNSMGAWIASLVAQRHPRWVSRVIAVNGGPLRAPHPIGLLPKNRHEARKLMAQARDPSSPSTPDAILDDLVARAPKSPAARMFQANDDLESHLLDEEQLGRISTPVDVVWGRSDRLLGSELGRKLANAFPAGRLTFIDNCGHLPQVECPQALAEVLGRLLTQDPPQKETPK